MVKHRDETLDRTFAALSDPTRRALLARLVERESLSVSELAQPFPMSLPAIMGLPFVIGQLLMATILYFASGETDAEG